MRLLIETKSFSALRPARQRPARLADKMQAFWSNMLIFPCIHRKDALYFHEFSLAALLPFRKQTHEFCNQRCVGVASMFDEIRSTIYVRKEAFA
jgi:hypothetical protein